MPCCEYQIFMTLSSLTPVLVILLFIQTTLLIFPICPLLHPDMPCFTSQYAVFRTAKGGISHYNIIVYASSFISFICR